MRLGLQVVAVGGIGLASNVLLLRLTGLLSVGFRFIARQRAISVKIRLRVLLEVTIDLPIGLTENQPMRCQKKGEHQG